ncbi:MAG: hypothetical protein K9M07_00525 [Simkaniaceae bacterium]|nr:hypothetical protein [Simkaniaceae bacterium]
MKKKIPLALIFLTCLNISVFCAGNSPTQSNMATTGTDLNQFIPPVVQKKYGLDLLSPSQRSQLAKWLQEQNVKPPQTTLSTLSLNISNGQYIQLDDGSVWEVDPKDMNLSQGWLSPVQIRVTTTQDPNYPYQLFNTATNSSVSAKRVTMTQALNQ